MGLWCGWACVSGDCGVMPCEGYQGSSCVLGGRGDGSLVAGEFGLGGMRCVVCEEWMWIGLRVFSGAVRRTRDERGGCLEREQGGVGEACVMVKGGEVVGLRAGGFRVCVCLGLEVG